jgi:predicted porin
LRKQSAYCFGNSLVPQGRGRSPQTIYGIVDTGYIKETGRDVRMGENVNNRIGFRGQEDLGNGLKATFELEKRFDLYDGTLGNTNQPTFRNGGGATGADWDGAANVGLASKNWGRVRFGRVNELTTETIRKFDPFYQYGVGSMIMSSQRSARVSNTARYDSPSWAGFSFGALYSLGQNTKVDAAATSVVGRDADNDGYGINLSYNNGPWMATGNWSRTADSNDSYVWNLGVAYKFFGQARLSLTYEHTQDKGYRNGAGNQYGNQNITGTQGITVGVNPWKSEQQNWLLGLEWDIGPGQLDASVQYARLKDVKDWSGQWKADGGTRDTYKYSLGYTYNLSKRTSVYGMVSYTDYDDEAAGWYYTGLTRESMTAFQLGITHKF